MAPSGDTRDSLREKQRRRAYAASLHMARSGHADPGDLYGGDPELRAEFLQGWDAGIQDRREGGLNAGA